MSQLKIIAYQSKYHKDFKVLSLEWLTKYDLLEEADKSFLNNPKETILDKGGHIFMAKHSDVIVGTISLEKINKEMYEISKLGVRKSFQRMGIGELLMTHAVKIAKYNNARKVILHSNRKLTNALGLYRKLGFSEISISDNKFLSADIMMEFIVSENE